MKYRRVVITRQGSPETLEIIEEEIPSPSSGEVLVKVIAAGVARADILMRTGHYPAKIPPFPFTPGYDIAGEIAQLGEGVSSISIGQRVLALTKIGGYSEYLCVPEGKIVPINEDIDPADAVSLVLNGLTAFQMFNRFAKVKPGEDILVHGAGSGVGTLILQLGSMIGTRMFGTESKAKLPIVEQLGAIPIDYKNEDFVARIHETTGNGVDAAFDNIGGMHLWRSFNSLSRNGRLIAYGEMAIATTDNPALSDRIAHHLLPRILNLGVSGKTAVWYENYPFNSSHPDWYFEDLNSLIELLREGKITPVVAQRFPLEEANIAQALLESATVPGKIVLICND